MRNSCKSKGNKHAHQILALLVWRIPRIFVPNLLINMNKRLFVFALPLWIALLMPLHAQELFCKVTIDATQATGEKQSIQSMQDAFQRFLNNTKWTNDQFLPEERVKCFMNIIINDRQENRFKCFMNLRVVRPVYGSTYESTLCNLSDKNFDFVFTPFQELQYAEGQYIDDITSLLSFYAYQILGFDYASFSNNGGVLYFQKAQDILNLASGSMEAGWTQRSTNNPMQSRYGLSENMNNGSYKNFQTALYKYHREGLDKMEADPAKARKSILEAVKLVQQLNASAPLLRCVRVFLDAKSSEMIAAFTKAQPNEKNEFVQTMQSLDPMNAGKYNEVLK